MTEKNKQVYELIGVKVIEKLSKIVYAGKYAGKKNYQLIIRCENKPEINKVQAFSDEVGLVGKVSQEQIWTDIEENNYADKRYLFYCHVENLYGTKYYSLAGWKELNNS